MRAFRVPIMAAVAGTALSIWAGSASAGLIGVNEDAPKFATDGGASIYRQMQSIGMQQNVISAIWTNGQGLSSADNGRITKAVAAAKVAGIKVVIAIYPASGPNATALGNGGEGSFIDFVKQVVGAFHGSVKDFIVLNEPNRTIFFSPVDPALAAKTLADAYDAIKAIDSGVNVIGLGLSPRGSGDGKSLFPVQFLQQLGAAYKALGRTAPLMDAISFHAYPFPVDKAPDKTSDWPTIGMADLARLKQAIWDAFNGTGQKTVDGGLPIHLDEIAYQVPTDGKPGYSGAENVTTIDEATQATYYGQIVNQVACDPSIASLSFFHFVDETERAGFQSGFLDASGSSRAIVGAVQQALSATSGGTRCAGTPVSWEPETGVVGFDPGFTADGKTALRNGSKVWGFNPAAQEDATFSASVMPVDATGSAGAPLTTLDGSIPAMLARLVKFELAGKNGLFVYKITATSKVNPSRTSTATSSPFTVGTAVAVVTPGAPALPASARGVVNKHARPLVFFATGKLIGKPINTAVVGATLLVSSGQWTWAPTVTFSWLRCPTKKANAGCTPIPDATTPLYTPVADDIGSRSAPVFVIARVDATNDVGSSTADTLSFRVKAPRTPANTTPPAPSKPALPVTSKGQVAKPLLPWVTQASGKAVGKAIAKASTGDLLLATMGQWTWGASVTFAWLHCPTAKADSVCTPIAGATEPSYVPGVSDVGTRSAPIFLVARATATNDTGSTTGNSLSLRISTRR